jgi:hypothetical protein
VDHLAWGVDEANCVSECELLVQALGSFIRGGKENNRDAPGNGEWMKSDVENCLPNASEIYTQSAIKICNSNGSVK